MVVRYWVPATYKFEVRDRLWPDLDLRPMLEQLRMARVRRAGWPWVSVRRRRTRDDQRPELLSVLDDVGPGPQIISLNDAGEFYVSSPWADSQVRHFAPDGQLLGTVGDGLSGPHGTATDPSGNLYVADTASGLIRTFERAEAG